MPYSGMLLLLGWAMLLAVPVLIVAHDVNRNRIGRETITSAAGAAIMGAAVCSL